jgi:large subunit ribosomal protein L18
MKGKKRRLKPTHKMLFRRRREGKTNYRKRLLLLRSRKPRLVVRKSMKYIRAQVVQYKPDGDQTVASAISRELKTLGWNFPCDTIPAAYLTGLLIGKKAKAKKIEEFVMDTGLYPSSKGSRIYAVLRGAIDAGVVIPHDPDMLPDDDRISGKHIASHSERSKNLPTEFQNVKDKIMNMKIETKPAGAKQKKTG